MLLAAAAVAYMLTVTVNGVPTAMVQMPDKLTCSRKALDIMLAPRDRDTIVSADCMPLGVEEEDKPASAPKAEKAASQQKE